MKTIVCSMGGGFTSSVMMPQILLDVYGKDRCYFVNACLPNEHPSMWRLLDAMEEKFDISVTYIAYSPPGTWQYVDKVDRTNTEKLYTPFDIFDEKKFIGNTRIDPCSQNLKRNALLTHVNDVFGPENAIMAVGITADEFERASAIRKNWQSNGYEIIFPMKDVTFTREQEMEIMSKLLGVSLDLYDLGFSHNNCHGACVKAGQRQWAMLWTYFPHVYAEWEQRERQWQENNQKDNTILRNQKKGVLTQLSLRRFREEYLEPAARGEKSGFLAAYMASLPDNPACMWCSAI